MLGRTGGAIVGYLVITFVYYWWHRARHEVPILWRCFHQVHHSPQRIEIITSFYKHPVEIACQQRALQRHPLPAVRPQSRAARRWRCC